MRLSLFNIFQVFLKLGFISFGGPVAHLSLFYQDLVIRRQLIDEKSYVDLMSLCQSLPGPASSQTAIAIGMRLQGVMGGLVAILGFLLPSVMIMISAGYAIHFFEMQSQAIGLHGFKIAVAAVILQAILQMSQRFCVGRIQRLITLIAAIIAILFVHFIGQIGAIIWGAAMGYFFLSAPNTDPLLKAKNVAGVVSLNTAAIAWVLFFILLFAIPCLNVRLNNHALSLFDCFYRTGALVFGGGHVILSLLESQTVVPGWIDKNIFLTGYGIAQAVPGPLFSFAAFLGTIMEGTPNGWLGGLFCVFAIYLPSILMLVGVMPIWEKWRQHQAFQSMLMGINSSVVGLLMAAFYNPIWLSTVHSVHDIIWVSVGFVLLRFAHCPQWALVVMCAIMGLMTSLF